MAARAAKATDRLVRLVCKCEGAVLVIHYQVEEWRCPSCRNIGTHTGEVVLEQAGRMPAPAAPESEAA